mmetsp:Transcript_6402/g.39962  ORF Transcript_6402/g.39962 Transcript_6402/m.39962 type:complete len:522 (-) Transcript_6402:1021-2586(-)
MEQEQTVSCRPDQTHAGERTVQNQRTTPHQHPWTTNDDVPCVDSTSDRCVRLGVGDAIDSMGRRHGPTVRTAMRRMSHRRWKHHRSQQDAATSRPGKVRVGFRPRTVRSHLHGRRQDAWIRRRMPREASMHLWETIHQPRGPRHGRIRAPTRARRLEMNDASSVQHVSRGIVRRFLLDRIRHGDAVQTGEIGHRTRHAFLCRVRGQPVFHHAHVERTLRGRRNVRSKRRFRRSRPTCGSFDAFVHVRSRTIQRRVRAKLLAQTGVIRAIESVLVVVVVAVFLAVAGELPILGPDERYGVVRRATRTNVRTIRVAGIRFGRSWESQGLAHLGDESVWIQRAGVEFIAHLGAFERRFSGEKVTHPLGQILHFLHCTLGRILDLFQLVHGRLDGLVACGQPTVIVVKKLFLRRRGASVLGGVCLGGFTQENVHLATALNELPILSCFLVLQEPTLKLPVLLVRGFVHALLKLRRSPFATQDLKVGVLLHVKCNSSAEQAILLQKSVQSLTQHQTAQGQFHASLC